MSHNKYRVGVGVWFLDPETESQSGVPNFLTLELESIPTKNKDSASLQVLTGVRKFCVKKGFNNGDAHL